MLVAVQFPLSDLRGLLPGETGRLCVPTWPLPDAGHDFVRGFGPVERRRRGGLDAWIGEETYCHASRALRFPSRFRPVVAARAKRVAASCAFRRLLCPAGPSARVEVGLSLRFTAAQTPVVSSATLLGWVASLPVLVPSGVQPEPVRALVGAGPALASLLLRSTTTTRFAELQTDWIGAGEPLVFVDADPDELDDMPVGTRTVAGLEAARLQLHHARLRAHGRTFRAWFLVGGSRGDRDVARRLRLHLLRLHAEREGLRAVLRAVATGRIPVVPRTAGTDALQRYLQDSVRLLERKNPYGLRHLDLSAAAHDYEELVEPGLRASLWGHLETVRRTVFESVRRATIERAREPTTVFVLPGEVTMNQYVIKFGDHNVVHGDVVAAERIQESFNRAAQAEGNDEIKVQLQQLAREVAEMTKALPPEQAREASRDLDVLTQEALSPAPRKKWYQLAADGLIGAATTVGDVASGVVKVVKAVVSLLGG